MTEPAPVEPTEPIEPVAPIEPVEPAPEPTGGEPGEPGTEPVEPTSGEPAEPAAIDPEIQEKINAKIARHKHEARRAKEDAEYWRRQAQPQQAPQAPPEPSAPTIDQFDNYDDFVAAQIDYRSEQKFKALQANQSAQQQQAAYQSKKQSVISKGQAAHEDFYDVTSTIPLSEYAMAAATELDNGSEAVYFLGKNKAEADRIYALTPVQQVIEINNISQKLASPAKPAPSKAPEPITPVNTAGSSGVLTYHPDMSDADYAKMRRQQKKR